MCLNNASICDDMTSWVLILHTLHKKILIELNKTSLADLDTLISFCIRTANKLLNLCRITDRSSKAPHATQVTYCLSCARLVLTFQVKMVQERAKAAKVSRNILPSGTEFLLDVSSPMNEPGSTNPDENGSGVYNSPDLSSSPSISPFRSPGVIGVQSFARNRSCCNHPLFSKSSSKQFFLPFTARSIRQVLSHVPSPAPVLFSHISALQFVKCPPTSALRNVTEFVCLTFDKSPTPADPVVLCDLKPSSLVSVTSVQQRVQRRLASGPLHSL